MDITSISTVLTSIKTATEIAKLIRESDSSLEKAELHLKISEIMMALADARMDLVNVQETLLQKDKEICTLKDAIQIKESVTKHQDAYYKISETGKPFGEPFCIFCWEIDMKLVHLKTNSLNHRAKECPKCKNSYQARLTSKIAEAAA